MGQVGTARARGTHPKGRAAERAGRWHPFWVVYGIYALLVIAVELATLLLSSGGETGRGRIPFQGVVVLPGMVLGALVHLLPFVPEHLPATLEALMIVLACLAAPLALVPVLCRSRRRRDDPEVVRRAAGIGSDWEVIFTGVAAGPHLEHLCGGPAGPSDMYRGERVRLRFISTAIPGVEVAKCRSCRIAWVRAAGGR